MTPAFEDDILRVIANIPRGEVLTYGEVANEPGHLGASRAVGNFLARGDSELPWWRVVTSTGRLAPGSEHEHARRLEAEGVRLTGDRVDMGVRTARVISSTTSDAPCQE